MDPNKKPREDQEQVERVEETTREETTREQTEKKPVGHDDED